MIDPLLTVVEGRVGIDPVKYHVSGQSREETGRKNEKIGTYVRSGMGAEREVIIFKDGAFRLAEYMNKP